MFTDDAVRIWIDEIAYSREVIAKQEKRLDRILVVAEQFFPLFSERFGECGLTREIEYNKTWIAETKAKIQARFNSYLQAL